MLLNQGVSGSEKGMQTQSLCLEGSKAVERSMSFPGSGENGKTATLYVNICQQNCSKQNYSVTITGL